VYTNTNGAMQLLIVYDVMYYLVVLHTRHHMISLQLAPTRKGSVQCVAREYWMCQVIVNQQHNTMHTCVLSSQLYCTSILWKGVVTHHTVIHHLSKGCVLYLICG